jgi:hypothetical protein
VVQAGDLRIIKGTRETTGEQDFDLSNGIFWKLYATPGLRFVYVCGQKTFNEPSVCTYRSIKGSFQF